MKKGVSGIIIVLLLVFSVVFCMLYINSSLNGDRSIDELRAALSERDSLVGVLNDTILTKDNKIVSLSSSLEAERSQ